MADLNEIADQLSTLTVMEAAELASLLEEKWGVSAAAPVAAAAAAAPGEAAAEEQTEFEVVLIGFGDKKIQVIKEIRAITGLGLKEAKELMVSNFEKDYLIGLLQQYNMNISKVAREAGIDRRHVYRLMKKYGIDEVN